MFLRTPIWLLLLAGCAVPVRPTPTVRAAPQPIASLTEIRIGVEILSEDPRATGHGEVSPDRDAGGDAAAASSTVVARGPGVGIEPGRGVAPPPAGSRWATPERVERRDLDLLPDVSERMTLRFLHALVGRDRDRVPQTLGWSYMLRAAADADTDTDWAEGARLADENEAFQGVAVGLLRRPMQHALRELPLVRDVEMEIEGFKARNVPTSGEWFDSRDEDRFKAGRVSLRWRFSDGSDPLVVTYVLQGWRLGVSRETVRAGFSAPLTDTVALHIGTTFDHHRNRAEGSAQLRIDLARHTRLRIDLATDIDGFPGPDLARELDGTRDGGPGVMAYIETIF